MITFCSGLAAGVASGILICYGLFLYKAHVLRIEREKKNRRNEQSRLRYLENPQIPLRAKARSLVRGVVVREGEFRSQYGYSIAALIESLESKFDPSMSFENFGDVWEIDHIMPISKLDLTVPYFFNTAIHPDNLQPLFRGENQSKGAK